MGTSVSPCPLAKLKSVRIIRLLRLMKLLRVLRGRGLHSSTLELNLSDSRTHS
jgi:hypothetical protein